MMLLVTLALVAAAAAAPQSGGQATRPQEQFQCGQRDGFYPDPVQCDKYWECFGGQATPKLCPDGLVFFDYNPRHEKCDFPFNVDCEGTQRFELQPPQSSLHCPRANGFFAVEDIADCTSFYQCHNAEATLTACSEGLVFDEFHGTCAWPDKQLQAQCKGTEKRCLNDGFCCDANATSQIVNGLNNIHPTFPHPTDCQLFYICLNGKEPRDSGCPTSLVFNDVTMACDDPKNVPGCEHWYEPLDYDTAPQGVNIQSASLGGGRQ
jgi:hypothetical protein